MNSAPNPADEPVVLHQAPTITKLGSLAELTLGTGPMFGLIAPS